MKRTLIVSSLIVLPLCLLFYVIREKEHLYDCQTMLSLDREEYSVGDDIRMTVTIMPEKKKRLTFFEDFRQNIIICLPGVRTRYIDKKSRNGKSRTQKYTFSPSEPLELNMNGTIVRTSDSDIMLAFENYGPIDLDELPRKDVIVFTVWVKPVHIGLYSAAEWHGSNQAMLRIKDSDPGTAPDG